MVIRFGHGVAEYMFFYGIWFVKRCIRYLSLCDERTSKSTPVNTYGRLDHYY